MSELSPWQKWKQAQGDTRPWHLLDPNVSKADEEIVAKRLEICKGCEHLIKVTTQCTKCGCFMNLKTKLQAAACPIGKW
jgi:hypothetical protein